MVYLQETRTGAGTAERSPTRDAFVRLLRSPRFDGFAFAGTFAMAAFITFMTTAPTYLAEGLDVSATMTGLLFVLVSGGFLIGSLVAVRASERARPIRLVLGGLVLALLATGIGLIAALDGW